MSTSYLRITVKLADMRRAMSLTPDGTLTDRLVYASMIPAEQIAAEIRANHPGSTVTVRPFR